MRDMPIPIDQGEINVWHRAPASNRPTVALIHGLTGTSRWWMPVINHLPSELGIVAFDLRGRGQSSNTPGPYDLGTLAEDVARGLDHLQIDAAPIAGYSMGGYVAALFALAHPDRTKRLLLVDGGLAGPRNPDLTPDEALEMAVGPALQRLSLVFDTPEGYFGYWRAHPAMKGHWEPIHEEVFGYELQKSGETWTVRSKSEAITEAGRAMTGDDELRSAGGRVGVPTRLLTVDHGLLGQPGGFVPRDVAEEAAGANGNLETQHLQGLNHYTLLLEKGAPMVAGAIADL